MNLALLLIALIPWGVGALGAGFASVALDARPENVSDAKSQDKTFLLGIVLITISFFMGMVWLWANKAGLV